MRLVTEASSCCLWPSERGSSKYFLFLRNGKWHTPSLKSYTHYTQAVLNECSKSIQFIYFSPVTHVDIIIQPAYGFP